MIRLGGTSIAALRVGTAAVIAAYLGATQVFSAASSVPAYAKSPTPSFSNFLGNGDRSAFITVEAVNIAPWQAGLDPQKTVDGNFSTGAANAYAWAEGAGNGTQRLIFDFGAHKPEISRVFPRQDASNTHGTWQWEGSDDKVSWTTLSGAFTLGNTITTVARRSGGFRYYCLRHMSGNRSPSPWILEFDFETCYPNEAQRPNFAMATGDRRATTTVTTTASVTGTPQALIDGALADSFYWSNAQSGREIKIALPTAKIIDEWRWQQDVATPGGLVGHGDWKVEGSNDDAAWTLIHPAIIFGYGSDTRMVTNNSVAYKWYRWTQVRGLTSSNPYLRELTWRAN